jgi:DNA-directed RNA polymerase subunit RPC12/RpoP
VAKPELGTKRLCASCGTKFYDLDKDPIHCPKCEAVYEIVAATRPVRPQAAPVAPRPRVPEEAPPPEPQEVAASASASSRETVSRLAQRGFLLSLSLFLLAPSTCRPRSLSSISPVIWLKCHWVPHCLMTHLSPLYKHAG